MRVSVEFQDESVEFDVPDDRLVGSWRGPVGVGAAEIPALVTEALSRPLDFPPLRQAIVPGDRVVVPLGADVPEASAVLSALGRDLESAGVEPGSITVLGAPGSAPPALPPGVNFQAHDPDDRTGLAYLATTTDGRRVYLNRLVTDADLVLPVGKIGYDPVLGYGGPWGVIFPGLSDTETIRAYQSSPSASAPDLANPRPLLKESGEVGWLLGCQLQLGVIPGVSGVLAALAGLGTAVLDEGAKQVDTAWAVRAEARAEVVVVGVGRPAAPTDVVDVARALDTATRLVRRGGKVVVLSRASGELGPAARRLIAADDPRAGPSALRGHDADPDYAVARLIAQALAWADVYLLSALDPDDVEGLSIVALDRPEEARRLVSVSSSCLFVSQAELARAAVADETD